MRLRSLGNAPFGAVFIGKTCHTRSELFAPRRYAS